MVYEKQKILTDMKMNRLSIPLLFALAIVVVLTSCSDSRFRSYTANVATTISLEDFRNTTFALEAPRNLVRPGKIYIYQDILFVNEFMQGVHFFDNSSPANPVNLGFLPVLANVDISARNQKLYVDNYLDLLTFDIADINNPRLLEREEDVFFFNDYAYFSTFDPALPMASFENNEIVVSWNTEEITEEVTTMDYNWSQLELNINTFAAADLSGGSGASFISGPGKAGSTSRFAIYNDYLYTLQSNRLDVYRISDQTTFLSEHFVQGNAETLFPKGDKLFIGTRNGMLIYDLSSPANPSFISNYSHINNCDPVVIEGNRAYVTLYTDNSCQNLFDELHVVDISDLNNPFLIEDYEMTNPRGLGVDNQLLFICDGTDGLKIYDRTDDLNIHQNLIVNYPEMTSSDVIPYNGVLMMTSKEGIYQFDYSDVNNIFQLSVIPVN